MFPTLRTEVEARFQLAEDLFKETKNFKGDVSRAAKGMMFVQVYAAYEYTVKTAVQSALDAINAHQTPLNEMLPAMLAMYLNPEISSLRAVTEKANWEKRIELLERALSSDIGNVSGVMPHDGSHYRYSALVLIFRVFGIKRLPVPRKSYIARIDEVVGNRNLIAHGTERAEDIGRNYTRSDMLHILRQMKSVCMLLVSVLDSYCADASRHKRKK